MNVYTVSFFGHRRIENPQKVQAALETLIGKLLTEKEYLEFLVGRDGEFDQLASSTIRRCKQLVRSDNSAHVWVLPYPTAQLCENEASFRDYYDEIEICPESSTHHFKAAHQVRNRYMVDRSQLAVFCIQRERGGAWQTLRYASRRGVPYIILDPSFLEHT